MTTNSSTLSRRRGGSVAQSLAYWTHAFAAAGALTIDRLRHKREKSDRYEHEQLMVWDDESPATGWHEAEQSFRRRAA